MVGQVKIYSTNSKFTRTMDKSIFNASSCNIKEIDCLITRGHVVIIRVFAVYD